MIRPNILSSASIGVVFSYDKRPSVSRDVEDVATIFCREAGYVPGSVDMFMHTQCPVEVENNVFVIVFKSPTEEDFSLEDMHTVAVKQQLHIPKPSTYTTDRDGTNDSGNDGDDDDDTPRPPRGPPGSPGNGGGGRGGGNLPRRPKTPSGGDGGIAMPIPL